MAVDPLPLMEASSWSLTQTVTLPDPLMRTTARDFADREVVLMFQTQDFDDLTHNEYFFGA